MLVQLKMNEIWISLYDLYNKKYYYYITIIQIKEFDNVEFVEEETFAKASLSWALDRIDQVSPYLDGIFEPGRDGEGVDIFILDTGNEEYFEHVLLNLIL